MSTPSPEHRFWNGQPVPKLGETVDHVGEIEPVDPDKVRQTPLPLPPGFEWSVIDITDPSQKAELESFLGAIMSPTHNTHFVLHIPLNFLIGLFKLQAGTPITLSVSELLSTNV
jgi:hypothetical protein